MIRNRTEITYVSTDTSFPFPSKSLMIVYEIIPSPIACPIDDETGIARSIRMTGTATEISSKLIDLSALTISTPTYTSADDVAAAGIIAATGARNIHATNKTPVVSAVSPVLPPASTPDADSINVVIVEVPVSEPVTVPIECNNKCNYRKHSKIGKSCKVKLKQCCCRHV